MSKIKTILRTDEMPKNAKWVVRNKTNTESFYTIATEPPYYKNSHLSYVDDTASWTAPYKHPKYCKNFKKSLRKIVNTKKPTRKELHKEIARLNKLVNSNEHKIMSDYVINSNNNLKALGKETKFIEDKIEAIREIIK